MRTLPFLLVSLALGAQAQSRIDEVLVYPGGAQVTRLAPVAAGAKELVLHCLTARFDPDSLQITAPAGVHLGPVQIETLPRERVPDCGKGPLDEDIRKLEARRDAIAAELGALDTGLGYLKALGAGDARGTPASGIAGTADSIRKAAQDALARQAQLRRQQEELDKQLAPLAGERERLASATASSWTAATPCAPRSPASSRSGPASWVPITCWTCRCWARSATRR